MERIEEAIDQLKFMLEITPKEPPEGCDHIDEWWKGYEDMLTAFSMATDGLAKRYLVVGLKRILNCLLN